ncbi:MAG: VirK/YbjX family protein [Schwartzia sp. (in: firmicutes)]
MEGAIALGKRIYDVRKGREARRCAVFVLRCWLHPARMRKLDTFFHQTPLLAAVAAACPFVYEQPTRAFFYHRATFDERIRLVEEHMTFLSQRLLPEVLVGLYQGKDYPLWESVFDEQPLRLVLSFDPGQRKEGLLSVVLRWGETALYQMIFWIAKDAAGAWTLWIGAMQGPNLADAKDVIKKLTKACHGFRTKNLILYATQAAARALGAARILAVTNEGYYANNHVRIDRKLKTNFSDFWREAGGWETADPRFDELPLTEGRKTMEEVPTRKRAVYRRRFALMDEIDAAIAAGIGALRPADGRVGDVGGT